MSLSSLSLGVFIMKKSLLQLAIVTSSLVLAGSVFAAGSQISNTTTTAINGASFKASTGVIMFVDATNTDFAVASKHTNGDTAYTATNIAPTVVATKDTARVGVDIVTGSVDASTAGAPTATATY